MNRPRKASDEDILNATLAALRQSGPAMSVQQVAERLDITQAALFRRFDTKQNLIVQALRWHGRSFSWADTIRTEPSTDRSIFRTQLVALARAVAEVGEMSVLAADGFRAIGVTKPIGPMAMEVGFPSLPELHAAVSEWLDKAARKQLVEGRHVPHIAIALLGGMSLLHFITREKNEAIGGEVDAYVDFLVGLGNAAEHR